VSEFMITYRGTVYPWQCDHMGHMNVMWYAGKFDEASWQLLSSLGLTSSRFRNEGTAMAAVEQHIQYKRELHPGDIVTVRSAVLEAKDKSIRFIHEMRNDETGEVAATSVLVAVHLDATVRKARSLPADVRQRAFLRIGEGSDVDRTAFHRLLATLSGPAGSCNGEPSSVRFPARPAVGVDDDVPEYSRKEQSRAQ
jgi:acyl-CoA thioester hydrolase